MTVKELYELTKSLMFEKKTSKDYDNYYIGNINVILMENFDLNNQLRKFKGKEELEKAPIIEQDEDDLQYEEEICREVLSNGLACKFFIDDDLSKFNIFNTFYLNAQAKYIRFVPIESEQEDDWTKDL